LCHWETAVYNHAGAENKLAASDGKIKGRIGAWFDVFAYAAVAVSGDSTLESRSRATFKSFFISIRAETSYLNLSC
jgi:hypothetical protein